MNEYEKRINRVLDYIDNNLDKDLTLQELADISCFSRFHFNRIFSALMGETLFTFIQRLRLERAASRLCYEKTPIINIALDCGFSNAASFSKSFKAFHGYSPSQWRSKSKTGQVISKKGQVHGNMGKEDSRSEHYNLSINSIRRYSMDMNKVKVNVTEREEVTVAYVRHVGPYAGDAGLFERLYGQLCQWAGPRGFMEGEPEFLSIYHDNPEITDEENLRISICLVVPEGTEAQGDINIMKVPGGKYAVGHFEIDVTEYGEAWSYICGEWLATSGYEPDERPCFEIMVNNPDEHPQGKHIVDIYEPVRPMA
jgi:AraC family transcriptional regulator